MTISKYRPTKLLLTGEIKLIGCVCVFYINFASGVGCEHAGAAFFNYGRFGFPKE